MRRPSLRAISSSTRKAKASRVISRSAASSIRQSSWSRMAARASRHTDGSSRSTTSTPPERGREDSAGRGDVRAGRRGDRDSAQRGCRGEPSVSLAPGLRGRTQDASRRASADGCGARGERRLFGERARSARRGCRHRRRRRPSPSPPARTRVHLGGVLSHRPAEKPNRPVEVRERALPSQAIRRSIRQAVSVIGGGSTDRAEVAGLDQVEQALPTVSLRRLDRAVPAPNPRMV